MLEAEKAEMSGLCGIDEVVVREIVQFQSEIYRLLAEPEVQQAYRVLEPRFAVVRESGTKKTVAWIGSASNVGAHFKN